MAPLSRKRISTYYVPGTVLGTFKYALFRMRACLIKGPQDMDKQKLGDEKVFLQKSKARLLSV